MLVTQDSDDYIITIGYCDYKSQEAITQSRHIPTIPFPFALQFSHTHHYRVHHLLRIPRVDTIGIAYISSYKIEHPKSHPRYNFQLKYTIYPFFCLSFVFCFYFNER